MPRLGSPMLQFILEALSSDEYEGILAWFDEPRKFSLRCMNKRNERWSAKYSKLFEEWHKLKPRHTTAGCKKSRFMSGLKKSEYFKYCKEESDEQSTSTEKIKIYEINRRGRTVQAPVTDEIIEEIEEQGDENLRPDEMPFDDFQLGNIDIQMEHPFVKVEELQLSNDAVELDTSIVVVSPLVDNQLDQNFSQQNQKDSLENFAKTINDPDVGIEDFDSYLGLNRNSDDFDHFGAIDGNLGIFTTELNSTQEMDYSLENAGMFDADTTVSPGLAENQLERDCARSPVMPGSLDLNLLQESLLEEVSLYPVAADEKSDAKSDFNGDLTSNNVQQPTQLSTAIVMGVATVGNRKYQVIFQPING